MKYKCLKKERKKFKDKGKENHFENLLSRN